MLVSMTMVRVVMLMEIVITMVVMVVIYAPPVTVLVKNPSDRILVTTIKAITTTAAVKDKALIAAFCWSNKAMLTLAELPSRVIVALPSTTTTAPPTTTKPTIVWISPRLSC